MHTLSATGPMQALYQVFVLPALSRNLPRPHHAQQLRSSGFNYSPTCSSRRPFSASPSLPSKNRPPEARAQKWNDEITAREITLVDPMTSKLSPPRSLYHVLRDIDQRTHRLVQLEADQPNDPNFVPACKIVSKQEVYEAERKRRKSVKEGKAASGKAASTKTLELNWAIDGNDLGHRLERVTEFLTEGRKVEIVLASKKRGRKATVQEGEEVLARIRKCVESVKGAREVKAMEGQVGGFATMVMQGVAMGGGEGQGKETTLLGSTST